MLALKTGIADGTITVLATDHAPHPAETKSEALYLAMGRFVDSLGGQYITAEDVNTTVADLEIIRRATRYVTGLSLEMGGSGNPSPYTAFGFLIGMIGLCTRGHGRIKGLTFEFHGGAVSWFVAHLPGSFEAEAITFGHVILGRTATGLDAVRTHELVHVRQYERWGLLFGPAYLACSAWHWWRGGDAYRDNPFEVEAYACDGRAEMRSDSRFD